MSQVIAQPVVRWRLGTRARQVDAGVPVPLGVGDLLYPQQPTAREE